MRFLAELPDPSPDDYPGNEWAPQWSRTDERYPDWDSRTSRVISGPLGACRYPGRRFHHWEGALRYCTEHYRVLKFWVMSGRWMARISRVA